MAKTRSATATAAAAPPPAPPAPSAAARTTRTRTRAPAPAPPASKPVSAKQRVTKPVRAKPAAERRTRRTRARVVEAPGEEDSPGEIFRKQAVLQISQLVRSARRVDLDHVLPFLEAMTEAPDDRIRRHAFGREDDGGEAPDAYHLTPAEARRLLSSNAEISAPVFVTGGARPIFDDENDARPIEQVLHDWLIDPKEVHSVPDTESGGDKLLTIAELREHFLVANGPVAHPYNLPDISNPLADQAVPEWLQSLNCNFFRDLLRLLLDNLDVEEICPPGCPNRKHDSFPRCDAHELTMEEFVELEDGTRHWHGTLMIADAGAITPAHHDRWSLGTWISCYEGDIGFAWQSNPGPEEKRRSLLDPPAVGGRWLYNILRPGDSLYMPPGTMHMVFRLPDGRQTLGMAGHILRRSADLDAWLMMLHTEVDHVVSIWDEALHGSYAVVVPTLVQAVKTILERVETERDVARFGGVGRVEKARHMVPLMEMMCERLVGTAARARARMEPVE